MADDSFKDFVLDQLSGVGGAHRLGQVTARKMFGGFGLYARPNDEVRRADGVFFAIISDGTLYFKTNTETKQRYVGAGMDCFHASEKQVLKNYYEVPADVLENPDDLAAWADEAIEVASVD